MNNISNIPKLNIMNFEGYSNIRTPLYMLDVIWNIWKEFHDDDDDDDKLRFRVQIHPNAENLLFIKSNFVFYTTLKLQCCFAQNKLKHDKNYSCNVGA